MQLDISRAIYDYWNSIRGDEAMPPRAAVQPGPIASLLPDLFILQWSGEDEITIRLAGTRVCTLLGTELAKQPFSSLWAERESRFIDNLVRKCEQAAAPVCLDIRGFRADYPPLAFEMVLLPVRDAGGPSRVLGSLAPQYSSSWQLLEPVDSLRLDRVQVIRDGETEAETANEAEPEVEFGFSALWQRLVGWRGNGITRGLS